MAVAISATLMACTPADSGTSTTGAPEETGTPTTLEAQPQTVAPATTLSPPAAPDPPAPTTTSASPPTTAPVLPPAAGSFPGVAAPPFVPAPELTDTGPVVVEIPGLLALPLTEYERHLTGTWRLVDHDQPRPWVQELWRGVGAECTFEPDRTLWCTGTDGELLVRGVWRAEDEVAHTTPRVFVRVDEPTPAEAAFIADMWIPNEDEAARSFDIRNDDRLERVAPAAPVNVSRTQVLSGRERALLGTWTPTDPSLRHFEHPVESCTFNEDRTFMCVIDRPEGGTFMGGWRINEQFTTEPDVYEIGFEAGYQEDGRPSTFYGRLTDIDVAADTMRLGTAVFERAGT